MVDDGYEVVLVADPGTVVVTDMGCVVVEVVEGMVQEDGWVDLKKEVQLKPRLPDPRV